MNISNPQREHESTDQTTPDTPSSSPRTTGLPVMIYIHASTFTMGLDQSQADLLAHGSDLARRWLEKGYFQREQPSHQVALPGLFVGKFPVKVGEYCPFVASGGYRERRYWTAAGWSWLGDARRSQPDHWDDPTWSGDDTLPVVGVSWYEADAYCRWLSDQSGRNYRLPAEAKWEFASRGNDGRLYPWGADFNPARCNNTAANSLAHTSPVGQYSPAGDSPWGHADTDGKVSEWTASIFWPYPSRTAGFQSEPGKEAPRVTRVGSWQSNFLRVRTTSRGYNDPYFSDHDLGFRLACDA